MNQTRLPLEVVNIVTALVTGVGFLIVDKAYDAASLWAGFVGSILVLSSLAFGAAYVRRSRQNTALARQGTRRTLELLAKAFGYPEQHTRTNVMTLSSDGNRREVDSLTACNMRDDPDQDLNIAAAAGISGKAFAERTVAFGDAKSSESWGMTPAEKAKVRQTLRGVLSAPIFDLDNPQGSPIGTVQVDSDRTYVEARFDEKSSHSTVQAFADALAVILKIGQRTEP